MSWGNLFLAVILTVFNVFVGTTMMQLKDEVKLMRRQMSMNTETKKEQEATVEDATDATDEDEDEFT
jgi:hypothetical protein